MRDFRGVSKLNEFLAWGAEELDEFLKAPRKAQEIFFAIVLLYQNGTVLENKDGALEETGINYLFPTLGNGNSPIEVIFDIAFQTYVLEMVENEGKEYHFFQDQYEISIGEKHYIVDFYNEKANLIVECDGHDFHQKTKEQVAKDNEREYDLKMAGYNILRFSGSQIYNRPFECAEEAYSYIAKLVQEKGGNK